ncbi:MAG: hypothetical protein ABFS19_08945 [Thermodesulfobacteriota bacterium]
MKKIVIIVLVVLMAAFSGWLYHYYSDSEVIKRQLHEASLALSRNGAEAPVKTGLKMRIIKSMLAPECFTVIAEKSFKQAVERDLIISYLLYYRNRYDPLSVTIENMTVEIAEDNRASVEASVRVERKAATTESGQIYMITLELEKVEKKWLVNGAELPAGLVF